MHLPVLRTLQFETEIIGQINGLTSQKEGNMTIGIYHTRYSNDIFLNNYTNVTK